MLHPASRRYAHFTWWWWPAWSWSWSSAESRVAREKQRTPTKIAVRRAERWIHEEAYCASAKARPEDEEDERGRCDRYDGRAARRALDGEGRRSRARAVARREAVRRGPARGRDEGRGGAFHYHGVIRSRSFSRATRNIKMRSRYFFGGVAAQGNRRAREGSLTTDINDLRRFFKVSLCLVIRRAVAAEHFSWVRKVKGCERNVCEKKI